MLAALPPSAFPHDFSFFPPQQMLSPVVYKPAASAPASLLTLPSVVFSGGRNHDEGKMVASTSLPLLEPTMSLQPIVKKRARSDEKHTKARIALPPATQELMRLLPFARVGHLQSYRRQRYAQRFYVVVIGPLSASDKAGRRANYAYPCVFIGPNVPPFGIEMRSSTNPVVIADRSLLLYYFAVEVSKRTTQQYATLADAWKSNIGKNGRVIKTSDVNFDAGTRFVCRMGFFGLTSCVFFIL